MLEQPSGFAREGVVPAGSPGEDGSDELYVCTWLFADSPATESSYPQVRGRSSTPAFQATYWRSVAVFFATSYRHQPDAKHLLFTNVERPPTVSGTDIGALLDRFGVEVVQLPLTYLTPEGHFHAWRNQFYVFDITAYLQARLRSSDAAIVLDCDSVWIDSALAIRHALARDGALTYVITFPLDWRENGLTREDMRVLSGELLEYELPAPPLYCGGEFLAATGAELRRLQHEVTHTWRQFLDRYARHEVVFNEEAQMLSHIYLKLGYPLGNGNPFVRRIWTGSFGAYNTARPLDHGLVVWHLPLEKKFGIRRLFPLLANAQSRFWTVELGEEWRAYLGRALGVPRNGLEKSVRDLGRRAWDRARSSR